MQICVNVDAYYLNLRIHPIRMESTLPDYIDTYISPPLICKAKRIRTARGTTFTFKTQSPNRTTFNLMEIRFLARCREEIWSEGAQC